MKLSAQRLPSHIRAIRAGTRQCWHADSQHVQTHTLHFVLHPLPSQVLLAAATQCFSLQAKLHVVMSLTMPSQDV